MLALLIGPSRWAALAVLLLAGLAMPAVAAAQAPLTVYSSLPHVGAYKSQSDDIVRGATMALDDHGGQAGGLPVRLVSLDDGTAATGRWDPARADGNARVAAADASAIAYLGELNSGASAFSMPITNAAGMLQVSPSNAYVGLTRARARATEPGEPGRYFPTGRRTYGRVVATDQVQADAIAWYLDDLGVRRVALVDDAEVYGHGLSSMLRTPLRDRGVTVARHATLRSGNARRVARRLRDVRADAMVYTGIVENGAVPLWRAVHRAHRRWKLLGADGIAVPSFTRRITTRAARRTYLTAATLAPSEYPPSGQDFVARFRARFGAEPDPYAIYGYEAMAVILDSVARAANPADRRLVVDAFFATRARASVLGSYSIDAFGDSTLAVYGGYRVDRRRRIVWDRVIDIGR